MAFKFVVIAWNVQVKGTYKIVLLALADYAAGKDYPERNLRKGECYPTVMQIAEKCGISQRQVRYATAYLEQQKLITKHRRFNSSDIYKMNL